MRGASAAPMPRHRSASTGLRSTTATAVPKHGGRSASFHQLCLCAKSFSTARLRRDAATILPTRRLIGHRATQIGTVCLWNACAQPPLPRCPRNLPKPLRCDAAIFPHPSECFASPCKLRRCATKCFQSLVFCASPRPPPFLHFAAPAGRPRVHHLQRLDHEKRVLKASCRTQSELLEPHTQRRRTSNDHHSSTTSTSCAVQVTSVESEESLAVIIIIIIISSSSSSN